MSEFRVECCDPEDWQDALDLLYGELEDSERKVQIEQAVELARTGEMNFEGLFLGKDAQGVAGVLFCMESGGRTIMLWPPRISERLSAGCKIQLRTLLMLQMKKFAVDKKARMVQTLLAEQDRSLHPVLVGCGFFRLTSLIYLRCPTDRQLPNPRPDVEYVCYSPERHEEFLRALDLSYQGSLDCPELNGARTLDEILQGHRNQGEFDPKRWFLAHQGGECVGCLLLVGLSAYNATEIAYVAVLPAARRRGLGRELTRKAIRESIAAGSEHLTLAVDDRNTPARRLYESEGFEPWDLRDAYLLLLYPANLNKAEG